MESVVLVIHLILALAIIAVVLIQPSEGGGLGGMGGGSGGFGGLTTARGAANILTRLTAIFTVGFIITSLTLAIMAGNSSSKKSILDSVPVEETAQNVENSTLSEDLEEAGETLDQAVEETKEDLSEAVEDLESQEPEIPVSQ